MITKVIERIFSKTPGISSRIIKGPHELIKKKIEKFDINGNCIESTKIDIWLNKTLEKSGVEHEEITTYKYDKKNNLIKEDFSHYPSCSGKTYEYENKYDKNGNLINYDSKYSSHKVGEDVYKSFGKGDFEYDNENRMTKSKIIGFDKDDFIHFEELINISYDNEGNINDKTIKTLQKGSDGFYKYLEKIHKFYFDDSEQRVEEIEEYVKSKENEELTLHYKQIINKKQLLHFDRNEKEYSYKELFYYDKDRLIKKEYFHPKVLRNEPLDIYKYEYIESVDS